jgi:hypothetical protein
VREREDFNSHMCGHYLNVSVMVGADEVQVTDVAAVKVDEGVGIGFHQPIH